MRFEEANIDLKKLALGMFYGNFLASFLKKRILFFKNEARKLLETKDGCGKNSQNEPKTKLAKLLKIRNGRKNEPKN